MKFVYLHSVTHKKNIFNNITETVPILLSPSLEIEL